jgi:hypothetical protein
MKTICDFIRERGAKPFVVPAMGSHGGAQAEGQREVLYSYGITEEYIGCPIRATMETTLIGHSPEGHPVYIDKYAAEADGIVVNCRIKAHTAFHGPYESGIMKMMVIGLGKQRGAESCHNANVRYFAKYIPMFGNVIRTHSNVLFGFAAIENAYEETCRVAALTNEEIPLKEPELLDYAKTTMARILIDKCDVLVIDCIGKDYSGEGADPNVTGTWANTYVSGGLQKQRVATLDLSKESYGNATGIGVADFITRRLMDKCDMEAIYANAVTSKVLIPAFIPLVAANDEDAIKGAVKCCQDIDYSKVEIIRIPNSLEIEEIYISESLLEKAKACPDIEIISSPQSFPFDEKGNLF